MLSLVHLPDQNSTPQQFFVVFVEKEAVRALQKKYHVSDLNPIGSAICKALKKAGVDIGYKVTVKTEISKLIKYSLNWRFLLFGHTANTARYEGTICFDNSPITIEVFIERLGIFRFIYNIVYVLVVGPINDSTEEYTLSFLRQLQSIMPRKPLVDLSFNSEEITNLRKKYHVEENLWNRSQCMK